MPSKAKGTRVQLRARPTFSVGDELRLLEQPDVLLHPRQRHAEGLGELADRRLAATEPLEHGAAGRVCEGRERTVDRRLDTEPSGSVLQMRARRSPAYLISVSSLNIGRYMLMITMPTMIPTPSIMIGSTIEVSDWIDASTSSS